MTDPVDWIVLAMAYIPIGLAVSFVAALINDSLFNEDEALKIVLIWPVAVFVLAIFAVLTLVNIVAIGLYRKAREIRHKENINAGP